MNDTLFRYKRQFLTCALILGYAYIHMVLTTVYYDANLQNYLDFSARLPFGQRLLVPALAHVFTLFLPLDVTQIFFMLELIFVTLFYFSLLALLQYEFPKQSANLLTWLFLLMLPIVTVINYRFTVGRAYPFYYPYDTASLFLMAAGYLACLRERWVLFIMIVFIATINRESAVLLTLLVPALHWNQGRHMIKPLVFAIASFILARVLVLFLVANHPGKLFELYIVGYHYTRFDVNLWWLLHKQNLILLTFGFAGLPLFWFTFYDYIPNRYRPVRFIALFYFIVLLVVGNLTEARLFSELIILMYLPVCVAMKRWMTGETVLAIKNKTLVFYLNRYCILAMLTLIALAHSPLSRLVEAVGSRL